MCIYNMVLLRYNINLNIYTLIPVRYILSVVIQGFQEVEQLGTKQAGGEMRIRERRSLRESGPRPEAGKQVEVSLL